MSKLKKVPRAGSNPLAPVWVGENKKNYNWVAGGGGVVLPGMSPSMNPYTGTPVALGAYETGTWSGDADDLLIIDPGIYLASRVRDGLVPHFRIEMYSNREDTWIEVAKVILDDTTPIINLVASAYGHTRIKFDAACDILYIKMGVADG